MTARHVIVKTAVDAPECVAALSRGGEAAVCSLVPMSNLASIARAGNRVRRTLAKWVRLRKWQTDI